MADDPLDEWRQTLAEDSAARRIAAKGQVKNLLHKKLREMELILQAVETLPENDPFRDRVEGLARLMKETPSSKAKEWDGVLKEFAACVKIARSMKRRQARWTPSCAEGVVKAT